MAKPTVSRTRRSHRTQEYLRQYVRRPRIKPIVEQLKADWYLPQEALHRAIWGIGIAFGHLEAGDPRKSQAELDRVYEELGRLIQYVPVLRYYACRAAERETKAADARRHEGETNRKRVTSSAHSLARAGTPKRNLVSAIGAQTGLSKTQIRNILKKEGLL